LFPAGLGFLLFDLLSLEGFDVLDFVDVEDFVQIYLKEYQSKGQSK
jgi:hypothetical protein